MKIIYILLIVILCIGCEKLLFEEDPSNTPTENFEIFWNDFDRYYAQFQIRDIDWDLVHSTYGQSITASTTDAELFTYLSEIVGFINDGHVNLYTPYGTARCNDCQNSTPSGLLINPQKYLVFGSHQTYEQIMEYRNMIGNNIGYISLKTFSGAGEGIKLKDERYLVIDKIINEFKDKDGIIIDVRSNGGGNSLNAETVAGRFADQKRLFHRFYQKNGSGPNDFSDWYNVYIEPKGSDQFLKPVVVLTSRATFSSAEIFVMAMQVFPHVTIVGDTTGGGIGNPIHRELPNGWTFRLSTKVGATADGFIIEGKGIPPDVTVLNTGEDAAYGTDRMLEAAVELIEMQ
ncbi:MAG: S41 family peptidase [Bacteroidales bacterium]|nr:S41 family peptidase [Bacteroidales bacterium]